MKSFVQKHGKLLISVVVALIVAAACVGTLMQNKQTRSLVGAWMIYDGYDGGDLAPNVLVFAEDGTGIGYALDSDGWTTGWRTSSSRVSGFRMHSRSIGSKAAKR